MLALSDHLGQRVTAADGSRLGRLADLAVRLGEGYPPVTSLRVGAGRGDVRRYPWEAVASLERAGVTLVPGAREADGEAERDELLLREHVLDSQIVDLAGHRVMRVGDVQLARDDGGLVLVAVEVGSAAVVRRLGLRRLAARLPTEAVAWRDLHLASQRGAELQLSTAVSGLRRLGPGELAELVAGLPAAHAARVLQAVDPATAAGALSAGRPQLGGELVGRLGPEQAAPIVEEMLLDDAVAALRHTDSAKLERLLERVHSQRAARLRRLLAYPATTAGGLMTPHVRTAGPNEDAATIRARLAADPPRPEGLLTVFAVDAEGRLRGALPPSLLLAGLTEPLPTPALRLDTPVDDVIDRFALHDALALPVLDDDDRVVGAVAVDDVLEELLVDRLPGRRRWHGGARGRRRYPRRGRGPGA